MFAFLTTLHFLPVQSDSGISSGVSGIQGSIATSQVAAIGSTASLSSLTDNQGAAAYPQVQPQQSIVPPQPVSLLYFDPCIAVSFISFCHILKPSMLICSYIVEFIEEAINSAAKVSKT